MNKTITLLLLLFFLAGCYYDNEEELYPTTNCDTSDMSYSSNILPILQNYSCISCHSNANPQGSVDLEGYNDVTTWVNNEKLLKSIQHAPDASNMPKSQAKMAECDINIIEAWITNGAPNN